MPIDNVSIGKKLRKLREERGLTQTKLAEALNMNQQSISRYEKGESQISYTDLESIGKFFDVSSDYFFELDTAEIKSDERRLVTYYRGIHEKLKPQALNLVKTLSDEFPNEERKLGGTKDESAHTGGQ